MTNPDKPTDRLDELRLERDRLLALVQATKTDPKALATLHREAVERLGIGTDEDSN